MAKNKPVTNYAELQKKVLVNLRDNMILHDVHASLIEQLNVAIDYSFYLRDDMKEYMEDIRNGIGGED